MNKIMKSVIGFVLVLGMAFGVFAGDGSAPEFNRYAFGSTHTGGGVVGVYDGIAYTLKSSTIEGVVFTASNLPEGLTIDSVSGLIYGNPTEAVKKTAEITATNSFGSDTLKVDYTTSLEYDKKSYYADVNTVSDSGFFVESGGTLTLNINSVTGAKVTGWSVNAYGGWGDRVLPTIDKFGVLTANDPGFFMVYATVPPIEGKDRTNPITIVVGNPYGKFTPNTTEPVIETPIEEPVTEEPVVEEPITEIAMASLAFEAPEEIVNDTQKVAVDLAVSLENETGEIPSVIDILKGNGKAKKGPKVYVLMEIGDEIFFAPSYSAEAKPYQDKAVQGKHRVLDVQMNRFLRAALKGTVVRMTAGAIDDNMELVSNIATSEIEFK